MSSFFLHRCAGICFVLCALAVSAAAQTQAAPAAAGSTTSTVPAPALAYQSTFSDYRAFVEQPVLSWPQANDTVNRVGGWRTYAREAQQAGAASAPAPAALPASESKP